MGSTPWPARMGGGTFPAWRLRPAPVSARSRGTRDFGSHLSTVVERRAPAPPPSRWAPGSGGGGRAGPAEPSGTRRPAIALNAPAPARSHLDVLRHEHRLAVRARLHKGHQLGRKVRLHTAPVLETRWPSPGRAHCTHHAQVGQQHGGRVALRVQRLQLQQTHVAAHIQQRAAARPAPRERAADGWLTGWRQRQQHRLKSTMSGGKLLPSSCTGIQRRRAGEEGTEGVPAALAAADRGTAAGARWPRGAWSWRSSPRCVPDTPTTGCGARVRARCARRGAGLFAPVDMLGAVYDDDEGVVAVLALV
jgi:hypothetical protein